MPLKLVDLIRRYVLRYVLLPAVVVTILGTALAVGFALWLEVRAETKLLNANAGVFEQLILSGDSVGLQRQLSAVASSRQWSAAYVLDSASRVIAAYPSENRIGMIADARMCADRTRMPFGSQGKIGQMCWDSNPLRGVIPTVVVLVGVLAVIIWSQASLGMFLGRTISMHTKSLEELAKLFVRAKPLDPEDLERMPHETLEATQLLQAIRQFIVYQKQLKTAEIESEKQSALTLIASQVAHDILSPLAALEVAAGDVSQLPDNKRRLIRSAVGRIRDIANSLLNKNRAMTERSDGVAADKTPPSIQLLSSLIESLVTEKRLQYHSRSHVEIEARMDSTSYGIFAQVQAVEFKRLLSNLINNAVEAMGPDPGSVHVNLTARQGRVFVGVQDNGKGISPAVLEKLGRRGETHGKPGGSGLGIYHARTSAESWGGSLEIVSEVGKGTTTTLNLPLAPTPEWFVPKLSLIGGRDIVILDDDTSIHQVWRERLDALHVREHDIDVVHVSTPDEIRNWIKSNGSAARDALYLLDYELLGYQENGLSLAEELIIGDRSILVTNRNEEMGILEGCLKLKVRMIPKGLLGLVPICVVEQNADAVGQKRTVSRGWDAILIDDDPLVRETWNIAADLAQKKLRVYTSAAEFYREADSFGRDTPVYIDATLGNNSRGEEESRRIHAMGFAEIYLATGQKAEEFSAYQHLRGVIGKNPPWAT